MKKWQDFQHREDLSNAELRALPDASATGYISYLKSLGELHGYTKAQILYGFSFSVEYFSIGFWLRAYDDRQLNIFRRRITET